MSCQRLGISVIGSSPSTVSVANGTETRTTRGPPHRSPLETLPAAARFIGTTTRDGKLRPQDPKARMECKVQRQFLVFDGNCAHEAENYEGEMQREHAKKGLRRKIPTQRKPKERQNRKGRHIFSGKSEAAYSMAQVTVHLLYASGIGRDVVVLRLATLQELQPIIHSPVWANLLVNNKGFTRHAPKK